MADIHLTKGKGTVSGWTERHGVRFMEIRTKLSGKFNNAEAEKKLIGRSEPAADGSIKGVSYLYRPFPTPQAELLDYNPWLTKVETVLKPKEMQFGEAEIILKYSAYDPWAEVEVVKALGAIYTVGDNSLLRGKAVVGVDPMKFAPYAFLRWDMK
jgi:acetoacetate decarboxylase